MAQKKRDKPIIQTRNEHTPPHAHFLRNDYNVRIKFSFIENAVGYLNHQPKNKKLRAKIVQKMEDICFIAINNLRLDWWHYNSHLGFGLKNHSVNINQNISGCPDGFHMTVHKNKVKNFPFVVKEDFISTENGWKVQLTLNDGTDWLLTPGYHREEADQW